MNEDFLETDLKKIVEENLKYGDFKICANLPYYITSPIVIKILESKLNIKTTTLMVQKEVALRFVANPSNKNYGSISVFVQYFTTPEILFNVSKNCFFPKPKIESSVIKLTKKKVENFIEYEELFFKILRSSFSQRRKKILNPLSKHLSIDKSILEKILKDSKIDLNKRAEELSKEQYINLTKKLYKFLTQN